MYSTERGKNAISNEFYIFLYYTSNLCKLELNFDFKFPHSNTGCHEISHLAENNNAQSLTIKQSLNYFKSASHYYYSNSYHSRFSVNRTSEFLILTNAVDFIYFQIFLKKTLDNIF